ncbi:MAG TPA: adenosylmethionine--8-amino-7-oxononanoate transaminase [Sphingomicrobium sp.]|nr:adenosylmethionine--8-amino-7-oxononanoate transaminase [Sphingomicrobium sp.]
MSSPVWHPFTQHGLNEPIVSVVRSEGAYLYTAEGRAIVDAISSWWVTTHGHSHPKIMAAIVAAANSLDQVIFAGFTHEPAEQLASALLAVMPGQLAHVFFTDSGSTSVEVALKMALGFWLNRGEPRHRIAVMEHSYHGDTIGAMSVGARGIFNQAYSPLLFEVDQIPFPSEGVEQESIDALERLCLTSAPPAAYIVEPLILGAGGMLIYGPETLRSFREVCERHSVLFIADEIMTGWGRTGSFLACEQAGIVPDLLCLSKGLTGGSLPLAVTLATAPIFEAHFSNDPRRQFFHSSSYTANPIACSAALANLMIWRDEPVLERVQRLTERQTKHVAKLKAVTAPRQLGTITAFELEGRGNDYLATIGPRLRSFFLERNVLLRPLGNTVYVMPPYCVEEGELELIYGAIDEAIDVQVRKA